MSKVFTHNTRDRTLQIRVYDTGEALEVSMHDLAESEHPASVNREKARVIFSTEIVVSESTAIVLKIDGKPVGSYVHMATPVKPKVAP